MKISRENWNVQWICLASTSARSLVDVDIIIVCVNNKDILMTRTISISRFHATIHKLVSSLICSIYQNAE
jgi:hypothetical protein